jgi:hypothetical protein
MRWRSSSESSPSLPHFREVPFSWSVRGGEESAVLGLEPGVWVIEKPVEKGTERREEADAKEQLHRQEAFPGTNKAVLNPRYLPSLQAVLFFNLQNFF